MSKTTKTKCFIFKQGHILYKDGDLIKNGSIFFIQKGKAEIRYMLKNKKEIKLVIPSGGFLGIIESLAEGSTRVTTAKFLEESTVMMWNKEDFFTDVSIIPELGIKSIAFLSTYLRTLNQELQEIA